MRRDAELTVAMDAKPETCSMSCYSFAAMFQHSWSLIDSVPGDEVTKLSRT